MRCEFLLSLVYIDYLYFVVFYLPARYFTKQELRELFQLGDTHSSSTQQQLEEMHGMDRRRDPELDEHIAFLYSLSRLREFCSYLTSVIFWCATKINVFIPKDSLVFK